MSKANQQFFQRANAFGRALQELDSLGCTIMGMQITDRENHIEIAPGKEASKLKGKCRKTIRTDKGDAYLWHAQLHNCTVKWSVTH